MILFGVFLVWLMAFGYMCVGEPVCAWVSDNKGIWLIWGRVLYPSRKVEIMFFANSSLIIKTSKYFLVS